MAASKEAVLELLYRRIELRERLREEERKALAEAAGDFRVYPAGMIIADEDDRPDSCSLLASGLVSRFNIMEDGRRQITALHVPGDFVDLATFPLAELDHGKGALTDCRVLSFSHAAIRQVTERSPALTRCLWMLTLLDEAMHRRWLVHMGRTSASSFMAHFICELYQRLEPVGIASEHRMPLPISQQDLADALGISAVHANRTLQQLRSHRLVNWEGGQVEIIDWPGLTKLAKFNGNFLFRDRLQLESAG